EARELGDQPRALRPRLAHAHDPPAAHLDSGAAHARERVEPVAIGARSDDLPVELGGGVEVVVVVVETGLLEALRLAFAQQPQRRAGLQPERLYRAHPLGHLLEVFLLGTPPGRAHAEARRAVL